MKIVVTMMLLIGCIYASGCGTVLSLSESESPYRDDLVYSGVMLDCWAAFDSDADHLRPIGKVLAIVDIPLSATADTVCLPYTIPKTLVGRKQGQSSNSDLQPTE